jgi:hypothetical protein
MIKKTDKGYVIQSKDGSKILGGPYGSYAEALKRLREVEYFKKEGGQDDTRRRN